MAARHRRQRAHAPLSRLLTATSHIAIWDDHDFGWNNADGSYPLKGEALRLFKLYWANPSFGLPEVPGVFGFAMHGDVDLVLTDGRYYRSHPRLPDSPAKTMFGAAQLEWLKGILLNARGAVKIIASGSQVWNAASRFDGLYQFPAEQKSLADFLLAQRIDGLLFVSGDRHFTELLRVERAGCLPVVRVHVESAHLGALGESRGEGARQSAGRPRDAGRQASVRADPDQRTGQRPQHRAREL